MIDKTTMWILSSDLIDENEVGGVDHVEVEVLMVSAAVPTWEVMCAPAREIGNEV